MIVVALDDISHLMKPATVLPWERIGVTFDTLAIIEPISVRYISSELTTDTGVRDSLPTEHHRLEVIAIETANYDKIIKIVIQDPMRSRVRQTVWWY